MAQNIGSQDRPQVSTDSTAAARDDPGDSDTSVPDGKASEEHAPPASEKKPSKLKQIWTKTGLDAPTLMMMVKGSLPPTIAIACYQAPGWQATYSTLGYLVAIASILGFCIMPRGKFIQTMILNIISVCFAAAINLLALYCVTQARLHTTPAGAPPLPTYNASASAVAAIWLCFFVYVINVMRALRPALQFPAILTSIFCIVSLSYGVILPDMAAAISFEKRLLEAFLTGFALATGVSFLVFPMSSRKVVLKEMTGYINLLNGLLQLETAFMASIENMDADTAREKAATQASKTGQKKAKAHSRGTTPFTTTPISEKLRETLDKMLALHTKLAGDITPAKREIAYGKLESHDLTELWKLIRMIFVPVMGLSTLMSIIERRAEIGGWDSDDGPLTEEQLAARKRTTEGLQKVMKMLHDPFARMTGIIDRAFQHVLITLELVKPPKAKPQDEENANGADELVPGTPGFAEAYKEKVDRYYASKEKTLREWFHEQGIELPPNFFSPTYQRPESMQGPQGKERESRQRQLFFLLYQEHLLWRVSTAVLDLVLYVEKRKAEGAFRKSKLIFPGSRTLNKWLRSVIDKEDTSEMTSFAADLDAGALNSLQLGEEFLKQKDPEHLPPRNTLERLGDGIRAIPKFFRTDASAFGLRVVAATMTIGIINYLHASQDWFLRNRLLWAEIMVAISMNRTAGQSTFNFALRVVGTTVAMVGTYVIWYIVDGHTAGVIVFLWLWITCAFYVVLKFPKILIVGILGLVTSVLIVGYELQVRAIGVTASEANGQVAYPIYVLAPYRLATVAGGLFVAFIWTIFPYPISESTEVRKDLAACLYLLSNYYSISHETVVARIKGIGGNEQQKGTHANNLHKARTKVFSKLLQLLSALQANSAFAKFQVRVGGQFPREEYDELIQCCRRLTQWFSLISYTSQTFNYEVGPNATMWQRDFHTLLAETKITSHETTSLLALLSSSLSHGQPLPPYVQLPPAFRLTQRLDETDTDILSIRHIIEPEYSAFAVLQALTQYIASDVAKVKKHVTTLVGEIDFTFHAVKSSSASTSDDSSVDSDQLKGKEQ